MFDQLFDRMLYCLMAAVLVIPEPATFLVCVLLLAGIVGHCGSQVMAFLQAGEPAIAEDSVAIDELVAA